MHNMTAHMSAKTKHYEKVYERFTAPISECYDCGRHCAPLNDGEPVCCSTDNAMPIVDTAEWKLLKRRTRMWHKLKPRGTDQRDIINGLDKDSCAIECRGAAHCERDNRSMSCRTFPFFPYLTKGREFVGLAYYWSFEDRCWVIANLRIVDKSFIKQFVYVYEYLFQKDDAWQQAYHAESASMRRVFSRWKRRIPLIGRAGEKLWVLPNSGGEIVPAKEREFKLPDGISLY